MIIIFSILLFIAVLGVFTHFTINIGENGITLTKQKWFEEELERMRINRAEEDRKNEIFLAALMSDLSN